MATPHNIVVIVGSLRKESFTLKIANALAKLAPDTLQARRRHLARHLVFQSGPRSDAAGRLAGVP